MAEMKDAINQNFDDETSDSIPLLDILLITLHHWPWIILSVVLCVGAAGAYLLRTPKIYSRSAEILIKDDKKGQSVGTDEFIDLGLFQSNVNINNEQTSLMSKDLMEEVVKRLGLDINYFTDGKFHDVVAYGYDLPVKLTIDGYPDEEGMSMNLSVSKDGKVSITDLKDSENEVFEKTFSGQLNDTIITPLAKILVSPTRAYTKGEEVALIINKLPLSDACESYTKRLNVELTNEKGTVIKLTFADQSEQRADDVLNTLIAIYNENWIRDKNQIAVSTSNFINDRLGVIERELGNVDSDISSYKSANMVPDVEVAASMYMNESQRTQAQILEVNNQLSMARYIRSYLTSEGNHDQLLPANTGLENSNIQSLIGEYNETLLQRNSLVAKSSEKNPLVAQLDDQLTAQRQAVVRTIDNEIVALNTQLKSLRGSEAQTMSRIASNPTQAKNLLSTERQQKVKESLYLFLLQKREENELSQAFTAYNTRVVNKPGTTGIPPKPNAKMIIAFAFLMGLAIPFGVTFVAESLNTKVRGRKDVENLATPFVGEIPLSVSKDGKSKNGLDERKIIVRNKGTDVVNEAFRMLRTNVGFMCNTLSGSKVISLTSFNAGSGKSFISVNLGMAIALKGKRVVVVDGDMRHASTSAYVDSPLRGLSNYLSGEENDVNKLLVGSAECGNFFVLPVGTIPPNPTELLESARFGELIKQLKEEFDYIIIDCPPIEVVADAKIIDEYVDRTFFILRAGLLERSVLPTLDRLYHAKEYRNMAFILNATKSAMRRYGHNYGYGYGYGYGYNYHNTTNKK